MRSPGPGFVDIHTHLVPSGDDGVQTLGEAIGLCREAAARGTAILYVTPHVNDELPLSRKREESIREGAVRIGQEIDGLEVRVGFELHPTPTLLTEDPARYRLDGLGAVLVECPLHKVSDATLADAIRLAEHVERNGLVPVLAHPERSRDVFTDPVRAEELTTRGWLLQVTGASLLGTHGAAVESAAWSFVEGESATVVASDGHHARRPPFLDDAFKAAADRLGAVEALRLFDGRSLDVLDARFRKAAAKANRSPSGEKHA